MRNGAALSGALRYVLADESCGKYFDFGVVDGACDCVPTGQTECTQADAENYHVQLGQETSKNHQKPSFLIVLVGLP